MSHVTAHWHKPHRMLYCLYIIPAVHLCLCTFCNAEHVLSLVCVCLTVCSYSCPRLPPGWHEQITESTRRETKKKPINPAPYKCVQNAFQWNTYPYEHLIGLNDFGIGQVRSDYLPPGRSAIANVPKPEYSIIISQRYYILYESIFPFGICVAICYIHIYHTDRPYSVIHSITAIPFDARSTTAANFCIQIRRTQAHLYIYLVYLL